MKEEAKKYKCGLIMPIAAIDNCTAAHWEFVRLIIKEALEDTEFDVALVSDSNEVGIIQKSIVQNIFSNDMVICDVSAKNPNVMFELGMRLAFDKPVLIIKDDFTNYSFDTGVIEHLNYPRDLNYHDIQKFKEILKKKLIATHKGISEPGYSSFLTSFSKITVSKLPEKEVGSMDYIFEAVSEMREEIRNLGKIGAARSSRVDYYENLVPPQNLKFIDYLKISYPVSPSFLGPSDPEFRKAFLGFHDLVNPGVPITGRALSESLKKAYVEYSIIGL